MRIVVRPVADPSNEIDLTHVLVAAIAQELWRQHGGNDQLNWIEAELHLQRIVARSHGGSPDADRRVVQLSVVPSRTTDMRSDQYHAHPQDAQPKTVRAFRLSGQPASKEPRAAAVAFRSNPAGRKTIPLPIEVDASRP